MCYNVIIYNVRNYTLEQEGEKKIATFSITADFAIRDEKAVKPSITTRCQMWQARLTKCDFACVKVRTRQLTALVDKGGKVSYA
jgi:hypothetical protein